MIVYILLILLRNLVFTSIVEGIIILLIMKRLEYVKYNFYCNLSTNLILNIVILLLVSLFGYRYYYSFVAVGEFIVLFFECWMYSLFTDLNFNKRLGISFFTNLASFILGIFI